MHLEFSIIIPVFNRPQEIEELLASLTNQTYKKDFEVVIVEDGSIQKSEEIVNYYADKLNINYFFKQNSGAGASRNFGMQKATGNYFIIFDSDCIIPVHYLDEVDKQLKINYTMTSFFTTGGIRGSKKAVDKFQPRSFNFGLSKKAFEVTKGFSTMKIGEDIDLSFRLWEHNFETQFIENAFVYHKRRATFQQFLKQTFSFGKARPVLNRKYPETAKITYWFPSVFILGFLFSLLCVLFNFQFFIGCYTAYFSIIFVDSFLKNKSVKVAFLSIFTTLIQFFGYGFGFLKSSLLN